MALRGNWESYLQKAILMVKLGICDADLSAPHMQYIAKRGWAGALEVLLSPGADPVSADTDVETTLHCATAGVVEMLCKSGVPIGSLDGDRVAKPIVYGWRCKVEVLLKQEGAKENPGSPQQMGKGGRPLCKQKPEVLTMLVQAGANPDLESGPKDPGL
jgi:hypothetical protein